jgi:hypothetical protein
MTSYHSSGNRPKGEQCRTGKNARTQETGTSNGSRKPLQHRGWTVQPCGQATCPTAIQDALRRTRSALRQFADLIAARGAELVTIDAKDRIPSTHTRPAVLPWQVRQQSQDEGPCAASRFDPREAACDPRKAMRLPGLMLVTLALVGASATVASANGQVGTDRSARGADGHQAPSSDEGKTPFPLVPVMAYGSSTSVGCQQRRASSPPWRLLR